MKKSIFLILAIAMGFTACEDDDLRNSDIPSVVLNGFTEEFPNATGVEWEKKAEFFEAEFALENVDYEAVLNTEGSLIKYKYDMVYDDLPAAVKTTITTDYDKTKIDEVELLKISENTYYQVEFEEEPTDANVIFEETGEVTTEITTW
ncbi:PepSY-like domain-containing protein [Salegentibacter salegens]|uniref:Putative beta-lactamase-inhibitor-like, PepSY-like n=1 Tax=Salegentibacter salegens TaxID=143223 RepID=A0A1M7KQY0_9FLAO|nr:PepSY-like domain-containing protein [Salegentibacter salegens]PRX48839.1 putative PepSY-like beta-lactamase-inhibitor [Salegentibacter salegens]SHM67940.1 Putative beta-lactamase-inhibitor-like, PepSY-like [Salegentibacter salegens]